MKGKYAIAPKLVSLASSILGSTIIYAPMQALLTSVAQKTGETCGLALMSSGEVEYIASVMGQSPLTLQFQAGQKAPLHCTSSGQVFLAGLPTQELSAYLASGPWEQLTPKTVTQPKALAERLRQGESPRLRRQRIRVHRRRGRRRGPRSRMPKARSSRP